MNYNQKFRKIVMDCQSKEISKETLRKRIKELKKTKPDRNLIKGT
ncbi:MAG: hypothetical protein QQN55_08970 [Nitrosopumilus sp.]